MLSRRKNMKKMQTIYTNDNELKNKRKKIIKNSTYAVIVACSIILGATLVAVNANNRTQKTAVIETSTIQTTQYIRPIENVTVLKDYNSNELQYNDTLKQWEIHKAIDLIGDENTKVLAIANGTVTNLYTNYLEGTVIEISHNNGLTSIYKSLDQDVKIKLGDYVKQGDSIGTIASSMAREQNSGNHLHLEMYLNNIAVNPNDYIDFTNK